MALGSLFCVRPLYAEHGKLFWSVGEVASDYVLWACVYCCGGPLPLPVGAANALFPAKTGPFGGKEMFSKVILFGRVQMLRSVSSLSFLEKVHSDLPEVRGVSLEGNLTKLSFEGMDESVSILLVVPRN